MMDACKFNGRRNVLRAGVNIAAAAAGVSLLGGIPAAFAQPAPLTIGLLRNPVSGLITLTEQKGWFKAAGVDLQTSLFTGAGGVVARDCGAVFSPRVTLMELSPSLVTGGANALSARA